MSRVFATDSTADIGPIRPLAQALPAWPLGHAAAARLCHDARFDAWLTRWVPGLPVRVGRRRPLRPALRLHVGTLAGDLVVDIDPHASGEWALLGGLVDRAAHRADEPAADPGEHPAAHHALACALADELIRGAAERHGADAVGAQVHRIERLLAGEGLPVDHATLQPVLSLGGCELHIHEVDAAFGLFLNEELHREAPPPPAELLALRLHCVLRTGARQMAASVLRSIEPGDTVLLGDLSCPAQWRVGAGCALGGVATIDAAGGRVLLDAVLVTLNEEADMDDSAMAAGKLAAEIDLPIHFELDTARLSLGELAALMPGHVIALETPLRDAPVRLVCQGQRLGSGRLIAIGDRLGVQIERMQGARGEHAGD
jgi:type III secretion protein Q